MVGQKVTVPTTPDYCSVAQKEIASSRVPSRNVLISDWQAFANLTPSVTPLETAQFVQYADAQRTKPLSQLPPIVSAALPHPERPSLRGLPPGTTWRTAFVKQANEEDHRDDDDHADD